MTMINFLKVGNQMINITSYAEHDTTVVFNEKFEFNIMDFKISSYYTQPIMNASELSKTSLINRAMAKHLYFDILQHIKPFESFQANDFTYDSYLFEDTIYNVSKNNGTLFMVEMVEYKPILSA